MEFIVHVTTGIMSLNQVMAGSEAPLTDTARVTLLPANVLTMVGPRGETKSSQLAPVKTQVCLF